jgi:hypothetical protein
MTRFDMDDQERDLSEAGGRRVRHAVEAAVQDAAAEEGVEGVWATVHDDRSRVVAAGMRELGTGAASLAQQLLKAADELMRMAGNAQHNSPNGFDTVARDVLHGTAEKLHRAQGEVLRYQERLHKWVDRSGWEAMRARDALRRELLAAGELLTVDDVKRLLVQFYNRPDEEAEETVRKWREARHASF